MNYFAYGSNMSLARLRQRVPGARVIGCYFLDGYDLRFHKAGQDGSAKCDAFYTGSDDRIYGVLFDIPLSEKPALDRAEGLGVGYGEKVVSLQNEPGEQLEAITYFALQIDPSLKPYDWYVNHLLVGAREAKLPVEYIDRIERVVSVEDADSARDYRERAIYTEARANA
ncbi:gamma-glutamylcyclotransferase family protein [uncultured Amphritea sp.]|uniref:gamma-glutamylcyclotransferase family protein n=1 Tax=uncultured Amphritea sp. TaxID=981605 RepID=UPI00260A1C74|nr:gamma-glutamylcyclotransferase family protein [uncultured Amphritea sp.]